MKYKLTVIKTNDKSAQYKYIVLDENGVVMSTRTSNREYVACTINGEYYFGRVDLIGKGDHGRRIKWQKEHTVLVSPIAYLEK